LSRVAEWIALHGGLENALAQRKEFSIPTNKGQIVMTESQLFIPFTDFVQVRDGNPLAASIANRHYSRIWKGNVNQSRLTAFQRMILIAPTGEWVFVWNSAKFRADGQEGANCVLFRNEGRRLSSEIILLAEQEWDKKYGPCRKFTYVHPGMIRSSNPGFCFQKAGWEKTGHKSKKGLILLAKDIDGAA
jgi:hypothetical protein